DHLRKRIPSNIKTTFLVGTDRWQDVARVRFETFDRAAADGCTWLISVDDDDGVLAIYQEGIKDKRHWPGKVILRDTGPIETRSMCNMFRGGYYGYRAKAWQEASPHVDRTSTDYEEWRVVWHLLRLGWKTHYDERVLQWQCVGKMADHPELMQFQFGKSWSMVLAQLEAQFGEPKNRWWQNWGIDASRLEIEDFWRDDPSQVIRREAWYSVVEQVIPRLKSRVVMDHGCGVAWDQPAFVALGLEYSGADVTEGMIKRAKERLPGVSLQTDDVFASQFADRQWPLVTSGAVLPHLPMDKIPVALGELWRMTGECLLIKLFGVDVEAEDQTVVLKGFLYEQLRQATWTKMIAAACPDGKIKIHRTVKREAKDVMVVEVWR
ncbi:MAG TPA: class I SAM-dependent methyltransferase, partial [Thermoleophilia bacterium]|nr:class I SAM-dependent methyltransferase [Thermoleophilia bacterium]